MVVHILNLFLLLIFFLVATRMDQQERELPVRLPEVTQAQPLATTTELVVNITREGRYKVMQREYGESQLLALLRQAKEAHGSRADKVTEEPAGIDRHR